MSKDAWFHKTVTWRAGKQELKFHTSQELFSSHDIDAGTRFLLRTIIEAGYPSFQKILDIGCGYGPLGLALQRLYPGSIVHLTDRDALAVDYARRNAVINGLGGAEIYGSLGYDDVTRRDYDLIACNIPGKAGAPVIDYLLREAPSYLAPGGLLAVVVVAPLGEAVSGILAEIPGAAVVLRRSRPGHTVFHCRCGGKDLPPAPALSSIERGVYNRNNINIRLGNLEYRMQTAYGLPEFDSLSYDTEMLLRALTGCRERGIRRVVVFNPGQGHVPVALWKICRPQNISLIDRDLLALRYSRLNLTLNDCPAENITLVHKTGLEVENQGGAGLIAGTLREDAGRESLQLLLDRAGELAAPGGLIILSGASTPVTRLAAYAESKGNLIIKTRERRRGYSLLKIEKT